jgi:hypothetical protein
MHAEAPEASQTLVLNRLVALAGVAVLVGTLGITLLAGCSSGAASSAHRTRAAHQSSRLSASQALRVSQMLYRNHRDGYAEVKVATTYPPSLSVFLRGVVDWPDHAGRFVVTTSQPGGAPVSQRVVFVGDTVYTADDPSGGRPQTWNSRPAEPGGRPIDQIFGLVSALASTKPDNPTLLQEGDLRVDHRETVRGVVAEVFTTRRKGLSYWVGRRSGVLLRVRGTLPGFSAPVVLDLAPHRPERITAPLVNTPGRR